MASADCIAVLEQLRIARGRFTDALNARNTLKGYRYDWSAFSAWCDRMGLVALPAEQETLALYVTSRLSDGRKVSTVKRNVASVEAIHRAMEAPSPSGPAVRDVLRGAQRLSPDQVRQVRPLAVEDLRAIVKLLRETDTPIAMRNRAIMLVGFCSALRSANLVALTLADVEFNDAGAVLTIRRSKTDQEGRGRLIGIPRGKHPDTCPVTALQSWIERRGAYPGALFTRFDGHDQGSLQPERIGEIVQQCLRMIGRDWKEFGSHSLRSGFVTATGENGASEWLVAHQTGHRDMTTLRGYFRRRDLFRNNAVGLLDL